MSPCSMESTAAFRELRSSVTSLITCTRDPKASTWARCPTRNPPIADLAADLACESRVPARMLRELSTAITVTSPERLEASTVCRT